MLCYVSFLHVGPRPDWNQTISGGDVEVGNWYEVWKRTQRGNALLSEVLMRDCVLRAHALSWVAHCAVLLRESVP